nr:unnamed protein product [Callosobruchus analis]
MYKPKCRFPVGYFRCETCDKTYKHKKHLNYHRKYQCGKEAMFPCQYCLKWFHTKSNRKAHTLRMHAIKTSGNREKQKYNEIADIGVYRCDRCGKLYKHKNTLNRHKKYECGKEPMFGCQFCSRTFHQKSNLKSHILTTHVYLYYPIMSTDLLEKFRCPRCGTEYRQRRNLTSHMKECGQAPSRQCPYCDYRGRRKNQIKRHIFNKHPEEFMKHHHM